jgi:hypothetical protein
MNKESRLTLIILSMLAVIFFVSTLSLYATKEGESRKKAEALKNLDAMAALKQDLDLKLNDALNQNNELKGVTKSYEDKIGELSRQFESQKNESLRSSKMLQDKELEVQSLKTKLDAERDEKDDLAKRLEKLYEEYVDIKQHLKNMLKTHAEMEKRAKELVEKEGISLGTIVIKGPSK